MIIILDNNFTLGGAGGLNGGFGTSIKYFQELNRIIIIKNFQNLLGKLIFQFNIGFWISKQLRATEHNSLSLSVVSLIIFSTGSFIVIKFSLYIEQ
jgi:hypothetical protein